MISIREDRLRAEVAHFLHRQGFHGRASGGADESRSFNVAVRGMDRADAGEADGFFNIEF